MHVEVQLGWATDSLTNTCMSAGLPTLQSQVAPHCAGQLMSCRHWHSIQVLWAASLCVEGGGAAGSTAKTQFRFMHIRIGVGLSMLVVTAAGIKW
jgi:hypothetical protein